MEPAGTVKANDFSRLVENFIMIPEGERERIWRFWIIFAARYCRCYAFLHLA
jgi:hypothetical protein